MLNKGIIKAINVKGKADFSRKEISEFEDFVKIYKANGLANLKMVGGNLTEQLLNFSQKNNCKSC